MKIMKFDNYEIFEIFIIKKKITNYLMFFNFDYYNLNARIIIKSFLS